MSPNKEQVYRKFYFKGKRVKESVYKRRLELQKRAKRLRDEGVYATKIIPNLREPEQISQSAKDFDGRRIINVATFGSEMICKKCNYPQNLNCLVSEERHGLASIFWIKCPSCNFTNQVSTDKRHVSAVTSRAVFDINTKATLGRLTYLYKNCSHALAIFQLVIYVGTLNAGMGNSHLNTLLAAMNMPEFYSKTFQKHEKEVGLAASQLAHESCVEAAKLERELTIRNFEDLKKLL